MTELTIYDGGIRTVKGGKRKSVIVFESKAQAAPGSPPLTIQVRMGCDPNYRDAILKALRRLQTLELVESEETTPIPEAASGEEEKGT